MPLRPCDATVSSLWRIYIFAPLVYNIKVKGAAPFRGAEKAMPARRVSHKNIRKF